MLPDLQSILDRKLRALFPEEGVRAEAEALLASYGPEAHHREAERVRLAVLKLSGADLKALKANVGLARRDYRDVLMMAEYPSQAAHPTWRMAPDSPELKALVEEDRRQYLAWLMA
jgi:hypothetical protein